MRLFDDGSEGKVVHPEAGKAWWKAFDEARGTRKWARWTQGSAHTRGETRVDEGGGWSVTASEVGRGVGLVVYRYRACHVVYQVQGEMEGNERGGLLLLPFPLSRRLSSSSS